jgi:hypothetical protein
MWAALGAVRAGCQPVSQLLARSARIRGSAGIGRPTAAQSVAIAKATAAERTLHLTGSHYAFAEFTVESAAPAA